MLQPFYAGMLIHVTLVTRR